MVGLAVSFGLLFSREVRNYPREDRIKIWTFVEHVRLNGFSGLEGRNKNSNCIDRNDPFFLEKIQRANKHNLWHYHIGIKVYDLRNNFGDRTSEYVLHYKNMKTQILVADMLPHPPFKLPADEYLVIGE